MSIVTRGVTYQLVDASKDPDLELVINEGYLTYPDDGLVLVDLVEDHCYAHQLIGYSHTEGLTSTDLAFTLAGKGIIAVSQASLDLGAIVEVADASRTIN